MGVPGGRGSPQHPLDPSRGHDPEEEGGGHVEGTFNPCHWHRRATTLLEEPSASTQVGDPSVTAQWLKCQTSCSMWRCPSCRDLTAKKITPESMELMRA